MRGTERKSLAAIAAQCSLCFSLARVGEESLESRFANA